MRWHRGPWIFEAVGPSAKRRATTMVDTIHFTRLPSAPAAILVVDNTATNQLALSTTLTWYQKPGYSIGFSGAPGPNNSQETFAMATSWRVLSKTPKTRIKSVTNRRRWLDWPACCHGSNRSLH